MKTMLPMSAVLAAIALVGCSETRPVTRPVASGDFERHVTVAEDYHTRDLRTSAMKPQEPRFAAVPQATLPPTPPELTVPPVVVETPTLEYPLDSKDQYVASIETRLTSLQEQISDLDQRVTSFNADAAAKQEIDGLRLQHSQVEQKLDEVRAASSESWSEFKSGMESAVDELQRSFDEISSKYID